MQTFCFSRYLVELLPWNDLSSMRSLVCWLQLLERLAIRHPRLEFCLLWPNELEGYCGPHTVELSEPFPRDHERKNTPQAQRALVL